MLRERRFGVQSGAWRSRWASAEPARLLARATGAFIDRAPIDWTALLSRVHTDSDRAIVHSLCFLNTIRDAAPQSGRAGGLSTGLGVEPPQRTDKNRPRASLVVGLLVALAAIQTVCSFVVLGVALANGEGIANRASQIVLALGFAAASLFLSTAVLRDPRSLFLLGFFASAASVFARGALAGLPETWSGPIDALINGLFPEAFMPACLWQFALDFPRVRRFTSFDVFARRATASVWLLGILLFGVNLLSAHLPIVDTPLVYLLCSHPSKVFTHLYTFMLIPPVAAILVRSRRAPSLERRKVARFAFAIAAGTTPFFLSCVARIFWPGVNDWLLTAGASERIWLDAPILGALAATPILTTAAVIVDRPFELQSILHHASRYALARSVLTATVVAPFAALVLMLYGLRHAVIADLFADLRAWLLLSCAAVGCLLLMARSRLLDALDRRLSRRAADHHEQLARSLERVRIARGAREILVTLKRELCGGIGVEAVQLLVPKGTSAFMEPFREVTRLPADAALVAMLQETTTPLDLSSDGPLLALLPKEDREWVVANDVELAAALKRRDGVIAAMVLLGPKRGGLPFDRRDRWFVTTLSTAAAAAWETDRGTGPPGHPARPRATRLRGHDEAALECPRCGVVVDSGPLPCSCGCDAALASLPHRVRGKFIVQRRLGAGGMGVVYLARDVSLDRHVALKTLPELGPGSVARLRAEARAMATLNHESLATIYGLELWRRTPVLVVEYFPNATLARRLAAGPMAAADAVEIGLSLARALTYVHAKGLLHRDLKPSNIGFAATGAPKVLDFGLATLIAPSTDASPSAINGVRDVGAPFAGTPAYLPPEAHRGAPPTAAFDLWALSVVMLEAMTGVNPFAPADRVTTFHRGGTGDLADFHSCLLAVPPALHSFFERALAHPPQERFHTSLEIQFALEAAARTLFTKR